MDLANYKTAPKYRSHKTVAALRIYAVQLLAMSMAEIVFDDPVFHPITVSLENKPKPQPGWFMVWYEGDYFSFSPAEVFAKGNTPLEV